MGFPKPIAFPKVRHNPVGLNKNNASMDKIKGGRPRLNVSDKKRYQVVIKMNTKDYYTLKSKSNEAGVKIPEFLRSCIHNSKIATRIGLEELKDIRLLSGMANNLNQLAHRANQLGYFDDMKKYSEISDNIVVIINKIRNGWKSNG